MKKIYLGFITAFLISLGSCTSRVYTPPQILSEIMQSGNFTFLAERANPTNFDVINVMNAYPGGGSQRFLNLDYGYILKIKNDTLTVELPYFGRLYTPSFDPLGNSFRFTTKKFKVDKTKNGKGNWQYNITADQDTRNYTFNIEVYKNGRAYLNAGASDRQPISYDGYVMRNRKDEK